MATHSKTEHNQAPIFDEGEVVFSVDEKLQSLIQFLYDNGIDTINSCEDNVERTCWIQFELGDWIEIADTSFGTDTQELYFFIEEACHVELSSFDDGCQDEEDDCWIEGENLIWTASVRFPKELLLDFEALVRLTLDEPIPDSEVEPPIH